MHYNKIEWQMYINGLLSEKISKQMEEHLLECDRCLEDYLNILEMENTTEDITVVKKKRNFKKPMPILASIAIVLAVFFQTSIGKTSLAAASKAFDSVRTSISEFFNGDVEKYTSKENNLIVEKDDITVEISEVTANSNQFYLLVYMQSDKFKNIDSILLDYHMDFSYIGKTEKSRPRYNSGAKIFFNLKNDSKDFFLQKYNKEKGSISFILNAEAENLQLKDNFTLYFYISNIKYLKNGKFTSLNPEKNYIDNLNFRFDINAKEALKKSKEISINKEFEFEDNIYKIGKLELNPLNTHLEIITSSDLISNWENKLQKSYKENNITMPENPEIGTNESYEDQIIHMININSKELELMEKIYEKTSNQFMNRFIVEVKNNRNKKFKFSQGYMGNNLTETYIGAKLEDINDYDKLYKSKKLKLNIYEKIHNEDSVKKGKLLFTTDLKLK